MHEQLVQIRPVDGDVGRPIPLHHAGTQRGLGQFPPTASAVRPQPLGHGTHGLQPLLQPPGLQTPHHIGAQLHPRAHFGKYRCAFKHPHIPPGMRST